MTIAKHTIFFAGGSKGDSVRADGNGGFMSRGYYWRDADGFTHGPYPLSRTAQRECDFSALRPLAEKQLAEEISREANSLLVPSPDEDRKL